MPVPRSANHETSATQDDAQVYQAADPSGMRHRLRTLGNQCHEACSQAADLELPDSYRTVRAIVVAGMGGSATGGDLLADLSVAKGVPVPIFTWRDYGLPQWIGRDTLVIASSYSGETKETLSAFRCAIERGASVVVVTSGGTLGREAEHHGLPVISVRARCEPRLAIGYSFLAPVALMAHLG